MSKSEEETSSSGENSVGSYSVFGFYSTSSDKSESTSGFKMIKSHHIVLVLAIVVCILLYHFRHKIAGAHDRYRTRRRLGYSLAESSFADDLGDGLSSNTFDIESNISNQDSRKGLLENAKQEIKLIMSEQEIGFDEARLQYLHQQLMLNEIGPDGMPLDSKTVTFSRQ